MDAVTKANLAYVDDIIGMIEKVVPRAIAEVAASAFEQVVWATRVDSGQAALNWHLIPHLGSDPPLPDSERMWGYGSVAPVPPAGYKWSKGDNEEWVRTYLIEQRLIAADLLAEYPLTGATIYNPITPGDFAGQPNDDSKYAAYAFDYIEGNLDLIQEMAKRTGEQAVAQHYDFVRVV